MDFPANPLEKDGYRLEFHDEFDDGLLNPEKWIPYYLPHWSSREQSAPRYRFENSALVLQIEAGQKPWCPEFDGDVKCSSIQTGLFAGEVGSAIGQHRFKPQCVVREAQEKQITYMPQYGFFELRMKCQQSPRNLVALWMIGLEETPEESGEICIFEVFGNQMSAKQSEVRYGIHPFSDPKLKEEFYREMLPMDARDYHLYALEWTPNHVNVYVDNVRRRRILQSPAYPMQFMLGMYELPGEDEAAAQYPSNSRLIIFGHISRLRDTRAGDESTIYSRQ